MCVLGVRFGQLSIPSLNALTALRGFSRRVAASPIIAIIFLFISVPAFASPSFDCTKAKSKVDVAICTNSELAQLDSKMATLYAEARAVAGKNLGALVVSQRKWLKYRFSDDFPPLEVRASCGTRENDYNYKNCLESDYNQRIDYLENLIPKKTLDAGLAETTDTNYSTALNPGQEALFNQIDMTCLKDSVKIRFVSDDSSLPPKPVNKLDGRGILQAAFADCRLESGTIVRVKGGYDSPEMPYGQCGAAPSESLSIWINGRKVVSRHGYAGFCSEIFLRSIDVTTLGGRICPLSKADGSNPNRLSGELPAESTCEAFKYDATAAIDLAEFPADPANAPIVGSLQAEAGSATGLDCRKLIDGKDPTAVKLPDEFDKPDWSDQDVTPATPDVDPGFNATTFSAGGTTQVAHFDLENNGKPADYLQHDESTHWFDGSAFAAMKPGILQEPFDAHDWDRSIHAGIFTFTYEHGTVFFDQGKTYVLLDPSNPADNPRVIMLHDTEVSTVCTFERRAENF